MGKVYDWAVNDSKEARAILELSTVLNHEGKRVSNGKKPTEEEVKELYVKFGGLVREKDGVTNVMGAPADVAELTIDKEPVHVRKAAAEEAADGEEDAPKRRGRRAAEEAADDDE